MSGGLYERTAAYIANERPFLRTYGYALTYDGDNLKTYSTKYSTVYPHDVTTDNLDASSDNANEISENNYQLSSKIYGDAVFETSTSGANITAWYQDSSFFPRLTSPFFIRGCDIYYLDQCRNICFWSA